VPAAFFRDRGAATSGGAGAGWGGGAGVDFRFRAAGADGAAVVPAPRDARKRGAAFGGATGSPVRDRVRFAATGATAGPDDPLRVSVSPW
jgi:hypothetical protein